MKNARDLWDVDSDLQVGWHIENTGQEAKQVLPRRSVEINLKPLLL